MNRRDQILQALAETTVALKTTEIAAKLGTVEQNIHKVVRELAEDGLVHQVGIKPFTYLLSPSGRDWLADPNFGQASRSKKSAVADDSDPPGLKVGVFTSGELQIEAAGKRLLLSRVQAAELVQFLDALPNRLFEGGAPAARPSPFAALGVAATRTHRLADEA